MLGSAGLSLPGSYFEGTPAPLFGFGVNEFRGFRLRVVSEFRV